MPEGNLYTNTAWLYDYDNRNIVMDDIHFYVEHLEHLTENDSILEIACGTGRVTLPMAQSLRAEIYGLELSKEMLAQFDEKVKNINEDYKRKIHLRNGDMLNFKYDQKFQSILIPWRALQFTNGVDECLNCIKEHLDDDGIFIFAIANPHNYDEGWKGKEIISYEVFDEKKKMHITRSTVNVDVDNQNQVIQYKNKFKIVEENNNNKEVIVEDLLSLNYYYPEQMTNLLNKHKFKIIDSYGYYDKTPMSAGSEQIYICKHS